MSASWNWKNKDGSSSGLLYESGNWGDLLKIIWLKTVIDWKQSRNRSANYLDPFAGDLVYPLTGKAKHRIRQIGRNHFAFLQERFLGHDLWPSAASGVGRIVRGVVEVFDADPGRRAKWELAENAVLLDADSGWTVVAGHGPDPDGVWLVDPYDFLSEWREHLEMLVEQSRSTTIFLYLYNRSAKNEEAFRNYRAFKNALEALHSGPKRFGRIAADPFLPLAHHEMLFLPSEGDASEPTFQRLLDDLSIRAYLVAQGLARTYACDA